MSNLTRIQEYLGYSSDLIIQQLPFNESQIVFLYITGLADDKQIKDIIKII